MTLHKSYKLINNPPEEVMYHTLYENLRDQSWLLIHCPEKIYSFCNKMRQLYGKNNEAHL